MAITSGLLARVYGKRESVYGTAETLAAADYLDVTECQVSNDPFGFEPSPEKTPGQDVYDSFQRRPTSSVRMSAVARGAPSGTTAPDIAPVLEAAMGAAGITVASAGPVTGATNTGKVLFVAGATDGKFRPQVGGSAAPLIPLSGAPVYKSVNYPLGDRLDGVTVRYQPTGGGAGAGTGQGTLPAPPQLVTGWSPNVTTIVIDGTAEPMWTFEGPAARTMEAAQAGANIADAPAGRTVQPANGMGLDCWFKAGSGNWTKMEHPFRTLTITQTAAKALRNDEAGSAYARGVYIAGQRETTVELVTWAEAGNPLYAAIQAGKAASPSIAPYVGLFVAVGSVEGARLGVYMPRIRFTLPSGQDEADGIAWTLTGRAYAASLADGNSSLAIGLG